jgi:hypothetical protein
MSDREGPLPLKPLSSPPPVRPNRLSHVRTASIPDDMAAVAVAGGGPSFTSIPSSTYSHAPGSRNSKRSHRNSKPGLMEKMGLGKNFFRGNVKEEMYQRVRGGGGREACIGKGSIDKVWGTVACIFMPPPCMFAFLSIPTQGDLPHPQTHTSVSI